MRWIALLMLLPGCGQLGPLAQYRADTGLDTATPDTEDTGLPADTGEDTEEPEDTEPPDDTGPDEGRGGVYTGPFSLEAMPVDGFLGDACIGTATVTVSAGGAITGQLQCDFALFLSVLGPQQGTLEGSVTADPSVDVQANLGLFFVFDELTGGFQAADRLRIEEIGTEDLGELGQYNYTATFDLTK